MNWLTLLKYLAPVVVLAIVVMVWNGKIDAAAQAAYAEGVKAAQKTCKDETVPAARAEEQKTCTENARITGDANADYAARFKTVRDRLAAAELRLQQRTGSACVPVAGAADIPQPGAGAVRSSGASGINARDLLNLGAASAERSNEFLACRAFVLDICKTHGCPGYNPPQ